VLRATPFLVGTRTKHDEPSTTNQAPRTTNQAPSTKHQAPSTKHQAPSTTNQAPRTKHDEQRTAVEKLALHSVITPTNLKLRPHHPRFRLYPAAGVGVQNKAVLGTHGNGVRADEASNTGRTSHKSPGQIVTAHGLRDFRGHRADRKAASSRRTPKSTGRPPAQAHGWQSEPMDEENLHPTAPIQEQKRGSKQLGDA